MYGVHFPTATRGYAVGWQTTGVFLRTDDGGTTWEGAIIPGTLVFSTHFISESVGFAVGYLNECGCGLIAKTTDGGGSWVLGSSQTSFGFYTVVFTSIDTGFVCGYDGVILKTTDQGETWRKVKTNTADVFRRMMMVDDSVGYALAGHGQSFNQPTELYKTVDGGEHWALVRDFYDDGKVFGDVWFTSRDIGYMVGNDGHEAVYRTTNGGARWDSIRTGDADDVLQGIIFTDASNGIAVGTGGRILRTTDAGRTWTPESSGTTEVLVGAAVNGPTTFITGLSGSILKQTYVASVTGSGSRLAGIRLTVMPHPVRSDATMHVDASLLGQRYRLRLYDARGASVAESDGELTSAGVAIKRGSLPAGTYYFTLTTDGGSTSGSLVFE